MKIHDLILRNVELNFIYTVQYTFFKDDFLFHQCERCPLITLHSVNGTVHKGASELSILFFLLINFSNNILNIYLQYKLILTLSLTECWSQHF